MKTILISLLIATSLVSCGPSKSKIEETAAETLRADMINPEAFELLSSKVVREDKDSKVVRVTYRAACRNGVMMAHTSYMEYVPSKDKYFLKQQ